MIRIDTDLGISYQDEGPWRSYQLETHGETREQLLANATISEVDQDGGELNCYGYGEHSNDVDAAVEKSVDHKLGLAALKETARV